MTARAEAHVLRLALIYTLLDLCSEIHAEHVHAALVLWRFCDRSAAYLFGASVGDRDADAIFTALRARPEGLARKQINVDVFHRNRPSEAITRALGLLQRYGLAHCQLTQSEGRPAEVWFASSPALRTTNLTNQPCGIEATSGDRSSSSLKS